jgi:hypothetical protein
MNQQAALVPGRDCGECTLCCQVQNIDKPDVQKPSGLLCRNCVGGGCAIYETRYEVCRTFHCAWRQLANLDESWRPDRSGILIEYQLLNGVTGVSLLLAGNPLKAVRQTKVIDFVANAVIHNIPIWLSLPGPPGYQGAQNLLNIQPMREAAATSRAKVRELLEVALRRLQNYPFQPYEMTNSGNNVGLGDG